MQKFSLATLLVFGISLSLSAQSYRLGAALDGFGFSTADRTESYGGSTYQFWDKTATGTGSNFLLESDGFSNKWQNGNVDFDQQETWFFGNSGSPDAIFTNAPTLNDHYVFKIRENGYANLDAIVMELGNAPATISAVAQVPAGATVPADSDVTVTATLSAAPSPEENVFLRYSFDGFATYGSLAASSTPNNTVQTFTIPGQASGTTVTYYIFTTTLAQGSLSGNNDLTNLATIHLSNNGGANFSALFPVQFDKVQVKSFAEGNQLDFSTASETNNSHFEVERSTDSRSWKTLRRIMGAGTTQAPQQYNFFDKQAVTGLNYYRIKQVDFEGTYSYSEIVSANWFAKPRVEFYPNPVAGQLQIRNLEVTGANVQLEVLDLSGKVMLRETWRQSAIDLQSLQSGVYLIRLRVGDQLLTQERMIKQ